MVPAILETGDGVTAVAHPNIALVKYWGKRDESLILPATGSLSMTLNLYPTTTTVRLTTRAPADSVTMNSRPAPRQTHLRVERFLNTVRAFTGRDERAVVETTNTVPTGAGLASSASGFAALATAAATAFGLELDPRALSRLARRGSGSACRSIFGGLVVWHAGTGDGAAGDRSSYAEPIDAEGLDPALIIAVVDPAPKAMSSREAMRRTIATSPFYLPWTTVNATDLDAMRAAVARADLDAMGEIAERSAFGMHATMLAARPPIRYLSPLSLSVLDRVVALRADGITAYATMDAGPNVKVLCARTDATRIAAAISAVGQHISTHVALPGPGAALLPGGGS